MTKGYPDWHAGVKSDIVAQTLESMAIDVTSQTIDKLKTDITAQTVDSLAIDVKFQTLEELASAVTTQKSESINWVDLTQTDTVSSGSSDDVTHYADSGYVEVLLSLFIYIDPPDSASSGNHYINVEDSSGRIYILYGESDYSTRIRYDYGMWVSANNSQAPTNEIGQIMNPRFIRIDEDNGLTFHYVNYTDVDQTNNRRISVLLRRIKVA